MKVERFTKSLLKLAPVIEKIIFNLVHWFLF
jgi:hypothetical protein